jgi:two-component system, LytTR family, response regulator
MSYATLIVDDEPMARKRLRRFLSACPELNLIAECGDGSAAVSMIRAHKPELVFLDVQMPGMSGFDVVRELGASSPVIVFVTAYDEFALRAFEAQALDYVLKPFREERVHQTVVRACVYLQGRDSRALQWRLNGLLDRIAAPELPAHDRLLVKSEGRVVFVKPAEIDWIEAVGDYVKLHVAAESHMLRATMADMEKRLGGVGFARIHRSRLVNLDRVKELRTMFQGESVVFLKNGTRLNASRACLKDLQERLVA